MLLIRFPKKDFGSLLKWRHWSLLADNDEITNEHIVLENEALMPDITEQEMTLKEYNLRILKKYLDKYDNNPLVVAEKLGIGVATVYRMMKKTR